VRRISAYGLCLDDEGRVLLTRTPDGRWAVPGAVVGHGQDPRVTVREAFAKQAGVQVTIDGVRDIVTDIAVDGDAPVRQDEQVVFDVRTEEAAPRDDVRWATPRDLDSLPLAPVAALLLGRADQLTEREAWTQPPSVPGRRQRFAAYALATDPKGNVLLALISDGYPGAGLWHLPGGGTHLGESAVTGLLREVTEETGQVGRIESVLDVASLYEMGAMGPEGVPIDFHGVSAIYRVRVNKPTKPRVVDHGGSTADAGWFAPYEALTLALTGTAKAALLRALAAR
jgi:8-oxo-dGTP diphosphatase